MWGGGACDDRGPTFCLRRSPPQEPPEENAPPAQRGPRRESRLSRRLTCSVADLHRSGFLKWGTDVCGCATARLYGLPGRGRGTRHSARGGEQGRRQAAHGVVGRPVDIRWDLQRRAGSVGEHLRGVSSRHVQPRGVGVRSSRSRQNSRPPQSVPRPP